VFLSIFFASPSPLNHTKKTPNLEKKKQLWEFCSKVQLWEFCVRMGEGDLFLFFEGEQMCERVCFFWAEREKGVTS